MLLERRAAADRPSDAFVVRKTVGGDAQLLREMFSRCSADTIHDRFHSPYPVVPAWMADLMVGVENGEAFVAVVGEEIVGHAMYARTGGREAEIAILVEDAWQSGGVGRRLLSVAAEEARLEGVETFVCETLTANRRVPGLAAAVFPGTEREVRGATSFIRMCLSGGGDPRVEGLHDRVG